MSGHRLYHYSNVGAGDLEPNGQPRCLHHYGLVTTARPCPFIESLSASVVRTGDGLTVHGWGLVGASSPTTDPWASQVRLYATASLAGSYELLTITAYTTSTTVGDTISVAIPDGVESGFVAVVHTSGAVCDGSNFAPLTVVPGDVAAGTGWWVEVWSLDGATRLIGQIPDVLTAAVSPVLHGIGTGSISLPADSPHLRTIIDADPRTDSGTQEPRRSTQIRVVVNRQTIYTFLAEQLDYDITDDAGRVAVIAGDGIEKALDYSLVLRPGVASIATVNPIPADVIYGDPTNLAANGGFEDGPELIRNGGGEDGTPPPWEKYEGAPVVADAAVQRTGTFSIRVEASDGEGAEQDLSSAAGERAHITGWVRSNVGGTVEAQLVRAEPAEDPEDPDIETVLDSDSVTTAATWRRLELEATIPEGAQRVLLRVVRDGTDGTFWMDDFTGRSSVDPWIKVSKPLFRLSSVDSAEGTYNLLVIPDDQWDGADNIVDCVPAERHRITVRVRGTATESLHVSASFADGLTTSTVVLTGAWQTVTLVGTTGADQETIRVRIQAADASPSQFRIDALTVTAGQDAASAGAIVRNAYLAAVARGGLGAFTIDFSGTHDSDGQPWDLAAMQLRIPRGTGIGQLCRILTAYGIGWRVRPGGRLQLFNRLGVDYTSLGAAAPVITANDGYLGGRRTQHVPGANLAYAEGAEGLFTLVSRPTDIAALGRRETYVRVSQALDSGALTAAAAAEINQQASRSNALQVVIKERSNLQPFVNLNLGDTIYVDLPSVPRTAYPEGFRIVGITANLVTEIPTYTLDLNWMLLEDQAQQAAALRALLEATGVVSTAPNWVTAADKSRPGHGATPQP